MGTYAVPGQVLGVAPSIEQGIWCHVVAVLEKWESQTVKRENQNNNNNKKIESGSLKGTFCICIVSVAA